MNVYAGKLKLRKTTQAMAVYGDATLYAQYVPKVLLQKACKRIPTELVFTLTVSESTRAKETK